jgi:hypothetical protein
MCSLSTLKGACLGKKENVFSLHRMCSLCTLEGECLPVCIARQHSLHSDKTTDPQSVRARARDRERRDHVMVVRMDEFVCERGRKGALGLEEVATLR